MNRKPSPRATARTQVRIYGACYWLEIVAMTDTHVTVLGHDYRGESWTREIPRTSGTWNTDRTDTVAFI